MEPGLNLVRQSEKYSFSKLLCSTTLRVQCKNKSAHKESYGLISFFFDLIVVCRNPRRSDVQSTPISSSKIHYLLPLFVKNWGQQPRGRELIRLKSNNSLFDVVITLDIYTCLNEVWKYVVFIVI